ncbi:MAG: class I SAM-dependent methyltransferase [Sphingomonadaceae bacterium]
MSKRRWLIPAAALGGVLVYGWYRSGARGAVPPAMPSAAVYEWGARRFFGGLYDRIAREVATALPRGTALDVGCGPGLLDVRLAHLAPELYVTGVDLNPDMVERARANAAAAGVLGRVQFQVADVVDLPFPDERFDLVFSTFSLHHWADARRGLAEIYRVLKRGGSARIYDIPDWLQRLTHHGPGLSLMELAAASPFGDGMVATFRWPGRIPSGQCLLVRRTP